jgi:HD-GYP domain-containing protein (c-di-GMP phosphodiesterase class II)
MALTPSIEEQSRIEAATERRFAPLQPAERRAEIIVGGAFVLACIALVLAAPPAVGEIDVPAAIACALTLAFAVRVRFVVGAGYTVPTQLAFVPLAFALPPALLAPAVAAVLVASQVPDCLIGRLPVSRLALAPANAWFALGPAVVLAVAGDPAAVDASLAVVGAMVAAQVAVDLAAGAARDVLHGAFSVRQLLDENWVYLVDAGLTPIAFVAAMALASRPLSVLAMIPLIGILALFARERQARLDGMIELNAAYRGTAVVLGDVVEADDGYTGAHCRDVVDLALGVGQAMGLSAERMRNLEFGALLHDVGKVVIPKDIINKPGKLNDDEWEIVKTHTIEGQRMLDRVGGFMCEVGTIVRSHHERWDGTGYPDRLAGAAIPLEARIIACCDSWNAMTTDRSYRAALPTSEAAAEMRSNAGTQFDPDIVGLVLAVAAPDELSESRSPHGSYAENIAA